MAIVDFDLAIIGCGALGSHIASEIPHNYKTVIIESSNNKFHRNTNNQDDLESINEENAFYGLGGNTNIWGGQLTSISKNELFVRKGDEDKHFWEYIEKVQKKYRDKILKKYIGKINKISKNEFLNDLFDKFGFSKHDSFWISPLNNNLFKFNKAKIKKKNIHLKKFFFLKKILKKNNYYELVLSNTKKLEIVYCKKIILTCGALENTKLVQRYYYDHGISSKILGNNLNDHLSFENLELKIDKKFAKHFMPKLNFLNQTTSRFIYKEKINSKIFFFSFLYDYTKNKYFSELIASLRNLQRNIRKFYSFKNIIINSIFLIPNLFYFLFHNRIYLKNNLAFKVHVCSEQSKNNNNFIKLNINESDLNPDIMEINWKVDSNDLNDLNNFSDKVFNIISKNNLFKVTKFNNLNSNNLLQAKHICGTTKQGISSHDIINMRYQLNVDDNIFCLSSANFPSSGSFNPTFILLCCCEDLINKNF